MKRLFVLLLAIIMMFSLVACGDDFESDPDTTGGHFAQVFKTNIDSSLEEIAQSIIADEMFGGHRGTVTPVKEGALKGFGDAEITGFSSGVMINTVNPTFPFLGYVFELSDGTDVDEFKQMLKDNADLNFNPVVGADQVVVENIDDKVVVIITPDKIEEVQKEDQYGNAVENELPVYGGEFVDEFE